jgi:hypothetical protein
VGVDVKVLGSVPFRMGWGGSGFGEIVWVAQPDQSATPKKGAFTTIISNEPPPLGRAAAHL